MKMQRRHVVVEYKGRRARKQNGSVWGNIDLKTITEEIKQDQVEPDLMQTVQNATKVEPEVVVKPVRAPKILLSLNNEAHPITGNKPAPAISTQRGASSKNTNDNAQKVNERAPKAKVNRSRGKRSPVQQTMSVSASIVTTMPRDELEELEQTNIELKRMLIIKLHEENMLMRDMLKRACSSFND